MTDLNTLISGPNPFSNLESPSASATMADHIVGNGIVAATGEEQGFLLTAAIPGDANGDGKVDINDLTIVLAHYNQTGQTWSDRRRSRPTGRSTSTTSRSCGYYSDSVGAGGHGNLSAVPGPGGRCWRRPRCIGLLGYARRKRT